MSKQEAKAIRTAEETKTKAKDKAAQKKAKAKLKELESRHSGNTLRLANQLEQLTGLEARVTILGHLQRGGTPSAADRLLATRLGTACADFVNQGLYGVMVAARGEGVEPVPVEEVVGQRKLVPPDHPWVKSARLIGANLGD